MTGDCVLLQRLTESLHVFVNVLCLLCARGENVCVCFIWHVCVFTCVCLGFPSHTVLSSIHSVLLNVTLLLASGEDSVLSWLVDLCHLVLALRG